MDQRITHEIEKVTSTLVVDGDYVTVIDSSELKESDFYELTESPYFLQVIDKNKNTILTSRNVTLFKPLPFNNKNVYDNTYFESFNFQNITFRSGYKTLYDSSGKAAATLQISVYERNFKNFMDELLFFNIWALAFLFIIVVGASIWAAKKTFKPINKIIETSQTFNAQNLNKRINIKAKKEDEIGQLRDTLNGLFERIEDYVIELSNFSDQVSHQLMNPLTAISTEIEYMLKRERSSEEYKEALIKLSTQAESMISIVKTLLVIAKSGKIKSEPRTIVNLSRLIKSDIYNNFKEHRIQLEIEENLYVKGEQEKYLMVLQNLLHNSVKYSPYGGEIKLTARKINSNIILQVQDFGIGIEDDEKEIIFKKFYRSDNAEKLGIKGFGLGLSLVKSLVEEVSGTIQVKDNKPKGTIFKVILPSVDLQD